MAFFQSAISVLQTLVIALGAGLGVWGVINLLEVRLCRLTLPLRLPLTASSPATSHPDYHFHNLPKGWSRPTRQVPPQERLPMSAGNDNPGAKSQGMKQLMAGGGVALIGTTLIPLLPHTPSPAPRAITNVCNTPIALWKNAISFPPFLWFMLCYG